MQGLVELIELNSNELIIKGWAYSKTSPTENNIIIKVKESVVAEGVANIFRPDLESHFKSNGQHAFHIVVKMFSDFDISDLSIVVDGYTVQLLNDFETKLIIFGQRLPLGVAKNIVNQNYLNDTNSNKNLKLFATKIPGELKGRELRQVLFLYDEVTQLISPDFDISLKIGKPSEELKTIVKSIDRYTMIPILTNNKPLKCSYSYVFPIENESNTYGMNVTVNSINIFNGNIMVSSVYCGQLETIKVAHESISFSGWAYNKEKFYSPLIVYAGYYDESNIFISLGSSVANLHSNGLVDDINNGKCKFDLKINISSETISIEKLICLTENDFLLSKSTSFYAVDERNVIKSFVLEKPIKSDEIQGSVDSFSDGILRGWSRNSTNPKAPVLLDIFVNKTIYMSVWANKFRADLASNFRDDGYHAFTVDLSILDLSDLSDLDVIPRVGKSLINNKIRAFCFDDLSKKLEQEPLLLTAPNQLVKAENKFKLEVQYNILSSQPKVSVILLNLNGAHLLERFFDSVDKLNTYEKLEFIVIDHNSKDHSETVCNKWSEKLEVIFCNRGDNYSFSDSNNYGASISSGDYYLFINNDIVWNSDLIPNLLMTISDERVGLVGIKLLDDDNENLGSYSPPLIQHLGITFKDITSKSIVNPVEQRYSPSNQKDIDKIIEVSCVTGAVHFISKTDFCDVGGYCEDYFYGYEDVDFCLSVTQKLRKKIVCNNSISAFHLRGYSRKKFSPNQEKRMAGNKLCIEQRHSEFIKHIHYSFDTELFKLYKGRKIKIAFAVTEACHDTLAGDYFTAFELAESLALIYNVECSFVQHCDRSWTKLDGFDVVIAMRDDYPVTQIESNNQSLVKIAWVRNWFERFAERTEAHCYDHIIASSEIAVDYLESRLGSKVSLLPIAANHRRFVQNQTATNNEYNSDYCFTGSFWGAYREIIDTLEPDTIPHKLCIYGEGWDVFDKFKSSCKGPISYKDMNQVYQNTRLVIDDANTVTKNWGSVNSRVFDALCAGALVVTNGKSGANEIFGELLPTYETKEELTSLINYYLANEDERIELVKKLRNIVLNKNTYDVRAKDFFTVISKKAKQQKIAIKIGAPKYSEAKSWGDYHFAVSMKKSFEKAGYSVRIDCISHWYGQGTICDDIVLVLRGLTEYKTNPLQKNIMWMISHPDKVTTRELDTYSHVFVASKIYAEQLKKQLSTKVSYLPQCTDSDLFDIEKVRSTSIDNVQSDINLFVGNSRNVYRDSVKSCVKNNIPLTVYGSLWEQYIDKDIIQDEYLPNDVLPWHYEAANVVLNDHWETMRRFGFISNRLYDALACGATVLTDKVEGMEEFDGMNVIAVDDWNDVGAFLVKARNLEKPTVEMCKLFAKRNSFDFRVTTIINEALKIV